MEVEKVRQIRNSFKITINLTIMSEVQTTEENGQTAIVVEATGEKTKTRDTRRLTARELGATKKVLEKIEDEKLLSDEDTKALKDLWAKMRETWIERNM